MPDVVQEIVPFTDITSLEKRMTALIIPNAITVTTRRKMYTFASFMGRDTAYEVMHNIWRLAAPAAASASARQSMESTGASSSSGQMPGELAEHGSVTTGSRKVTFCACGRNQEHFATVPMDCVLPGTPEKIYNLMFASGFIKDFMRADQKLVDLQMSDWVPGTAPTLLTRNMSYIKPLSAAIGPKQTKCELQDQVLHLDFDEWVSVMTTTRTPDVPSGGAFAVKTRTCITWAGRGTTRVLVTSAVEWTGSSFIKGACHPACAYVWLTHTCRHYQQCID